MGALDEFLVRQIQEAERIAKPLWEMEAAMKAALGFGPLQEVVRWHADIGEQYRTLAEKMALDYAPLLRGLEVGAELHALIEEQRRAQERFAMLGAGLPDMSSFTERVESLMDFKDVMPKRFASGPPAKLWYGREPGSPNRRPVFIETDD